MKKYKNHPIYLVDSLLSADECCELVVLAEQRGYLPAKQIDRGRLNHEVLFFEKSLAAIIRSRLSEHLSEFVTDDLIEFYRYKKGCLILPHEDKHRLVEPHLNSNHTLVIYLTDLFDGGYTIFRAAGLFFRPSLGGAILFSQSLWHEASEVRSGIKIVARLDVHVRKISQI